MCYTLTMMQTVTLQLPNRVASTARSLAEQTKRPIEDILVEWLDQAVADLPVDILPKAIKCHFARRMEFAATIAKTAYAVWGPVGEGRLCTCRRGFNRRLKCQIMPFVGIA